MFKIIVVDEIGTTKEVNAVRTIAQRGVGLVGTAHGITIHSLLSNSDINGVVGGIRSVTLGDAEARTRSKEMAKNSNGQRPPAAKKNVLERAHEAPFSVLIEIVDRNHFRIFSDVDKCVDSLLRTGKCIVEERWIDEDGYYRSKFIEDSKSLNL